MKLVTITLNTPPSTAKQYNYRVDITNNAGTDVAVHYGKFYAFNGQPTVTLDLEDVLYNYRYVSQQGLEPTLDVTNNRWSMPAWVQNWNGVSGKGDAVSLTDYWYNTVKVISTDTSRQFNDASKTFWFTPNNVFGHPEVSIPLINDGVWLPILDNQPMPHIPSNAPAGFKWSTIIHPYSGQTTQIALAVDGTQIGGLHTISAETYANFRNGTSSYSVVYKRGQTTTKTKTVAVVDSCNKPYYLVWLTDSGAMQCQGFLKTSEFSINYTNHNRVDMHSSQWKVNSTTTGHWKLKSQNLSDTDFKAYGDIFNSPYVVLLDMENNRLHYVNVVDTDYREKQRTRVDRKPIYFEIEVETADHLNV